MYRRCEMYMMETALHFQRQLLHRFTYNMMLDKNTCKQVEPINDNTEIQLYGLCNWFLLVAVSVDVAITMNHRNSV